VNDVLLVALALVGWVAASLFAGLFMAAKEHHRELATHFENAIARLETERQDLLDRYQFPRAKQFEAAARVTPAPPAPSYSIADEWGLDEEEITAEEAEELARAVAAMEFPG
jgi:hypothetical protein